MGEKYLKVFFPKAKQVTTHFKTMLQTDQFIADIRASTFAVGKNE